jgi:hypothetical protein
MMKKMKNIGFVLAGAALLSFASCADFLDEKGYRADYKYYDTAAGAESLVAASYNGLRSFATSGNVTGIVTWEQIGTDIYTGGAEGGSLPSFGYYQAQMNPSSGDIPWNGFYEAIATINQGLVSIPKSPIADDIKKVRVAELKFLRSYYFFFLVQHFGKAVLMLEPVTEPKLDLVLSTQKDVLAKAIGDTTEAWNDLPWANAAGQVTGDYGRASKGAAGFLLAHMHMYRYSQRWAGQGQSNSAMNEDRGAQSDDLAKTIFYAEQVCNFGAGAGSGSNHSLAADYADLWRWNPKTGNTSLDNYRGSELIFAAMYYNSPFFNNVNDLTSVHDGGNWMHLQGTMWSEGVTTITVGGNADGSNNIWGWVEDTTTGQPVAGSHGVYRDIITGRAWRRFAPSPYFYSDEGLFGRQAYTNGKPGKLQDARLYKGLNWVYYANDNIGTAAQEQPTVRWRALSNGAGSFNPASIGKQEGALRYQRGDTAIVVSLENLNTRFPNGTPAEKLALARAERSYWYLPMQSIPVPTAQQVNERDAITNMFPSLAKHLDSRRPTSDAQAGFRDLMLYRLAELYIVLGEAYALNGQFSEAAAAINVVRDRAAWKEGESKYNHFFMFDGGSRADLTKSTQEDMRISADFLSSMSEAELLDFFLDEQGRECYGEANRWSRLVRNGADFFVNRVRSHNYLASGNVQPHHRFRPIPQSHLDAIDPKRPEDQNPGY